MFGKKTGVAVNDDGSRRDGPLAAVSWRWNFVDTLKKDDKQKDEKRYT